MMKQYTINLYIRTMSEGIINIIDNWSYSDFEIDAELEFYYSPAEKMTHDYPGCDEELILESVKACFGDLEIDSIDNLEEFTKEVIKVMHEEGLENEV